MHIIQASQHVGTDLLYARGIVDEATHWSTRPSIDEKTPSDSSDSAVSSGEGSRMDPNTLFFVKGDVILLSTFKGHPS